MRSKFESYVLCNQYLNVCIMKYTFPIKNSIKILDFFSKYLVYGKN